jgi:hypothetical protein
MVIGCADSSSKGWCRDLPSIGVNPVPSGVKTQKKSIDRMG